MTAEDLQVALDIVQDGLAPEPLQGWAVMVLEVGGVLPRPNVTAWQLSEFYSNGPVASIMWAMLRNPSLSFSASGYFMESGSASTSYGGRREATGIVKI